MDLSRLVDWIKLSPRYLLPIALFTGFVLFAPKRWLDVFGVTVWVNEYRWVFGLIFLASVALVASGLIVDGYLGITERRRVRRRRAEEERNMRRRLHELTEDEKELLRPFIITGSRTQYLSMLDGRVGQMEAEKILFRAANVGHHPTEWAYNLQPWAWNYLNKHPRLLDETE